MIKRKKYSSCPKNVIPLIAQIWSGTYLKKMVHAQEQVRQPYWICRISWGVLAYPMTKNVSVSHNQCHSGKKYDRCYLVKQSIILIIIVKTVLPLHINWTMPLMVIRRCLQYLIQWNLLLTLSGSPRTWKDRDWNRTNIGRCWVESLFHWSSTAWYVVDWMGKSWLNTIYHGTSLWRPQQNDEKYFMKTSDPQFKWPIPQVDWSTNVHFTLQYM